ncbi:hypothetical protein L1987_29223 [Smallanthus sonchifolius]|uniref:Uncharacterized protein n=1 Tax=Smallanthus sonchifolius TaxID=185202 RepID=A0ACB9HZE1_9ASTR|nr:hypothetical protein L1987_29223 [Smallanthus sonchifolius]
MKDNSVTQGWPVAPNSKSTSTEMEMEMENSNIDTLRGGRPAQIAISIDQTPPQFPNPAQFLNYPGILYLIYAATLLYMFPSMIALVDLKFQNNAHSVFESRSLFANMAVVAYIIAIPTSVALFCLKASSNWERLPPIYLRILKSVFYFSSLVAPLSFVLVLFLPQRFNLIGYSLVFTLFLFIVACSFSNYIFKKDAPNFDALETSSHHALTIIEE